MGYERLYGSREVMTAPQIHNSSEPEPIRQGTGYYPPSRVSLSYSFHIGNSTNRLTQLSAICLYKLGNQINLNLPNTVIALTESASVE